MFQDRKQIILSFFFLICGIYAFRLFYLQVIDDTYQTIGSTGALKKEVQVPLRGQIYDRNGKLLVANVDVYDMYVTPYKVKPMDTTMFCRLFNITRSYFDSTMTAAKSYSRNRATLFLRQLSKEDYARVADAMVNFPGFTFEQSFFRTYPARTMANALGYIGEISKKAYEEQEVEYYRSGDYIGITGLEKEYEMELRGRRGVKFTMMNVHGENKGSYSNGEFDTLAVIGKNLYTTVDVEVQQLADSLFQGKTGCAVAIEPRSGEILAIGSYPYYDPNILSGKQFAKNFKELYRNPDKPLNDRVATGFFRPGSTFKLVQALVALQLGAITPETFYVCGNAPVKCHGHPSGDLHNAVRFSCNPYFYQVFRKTMGMAGETNPFKEAPIMLSKWHEMVAKFGYGQKLGIDLPSESSGLLPSVKYYDKRYGQYQWKFSNIYSLSIGEGEVSVNMLKMANLAATIANRGYWVTPHLVRGIGQNGKGVKPEHREVHRTDIDTRNFEAIIGGMQDAVERGTVGGGAGIVEGIEICGKTGTSQNKKGKDNSIFIAFAPRYNPKIAIAVMVQNAGFGGSYAAPIATLMIEKYLKRKIERTALKERMMNTHIKTVEAMAAGANAKPIPSTTQDSKINTPSNSKPNAPVKPEKGATEKVIKTTFVKPKEQNVNQTK
ncbi:penicillin-binding protein 2 [Emticicia oligotrophica DSM 17448]|uniref:Beta-lactamase n=1 Tax=Emticicia oligotrophica (strain DSM 17448 / CIP 109782 / MTCC 6937 / GPTSA100-15) TaxID=929562 RepID=A0ABN4ARD7_EMTOG|nr:MULTISPECIES: penicillin-binding transpeptidase domain-containing protein [Emticicia]AFK04017.1 penicillin-binding protein 2 [Emticicia oligotrophica DSM 17448]